MGWLKLIMSFIIGAAITGWLTSTVSAPTHYADGKPLAIARGWPLQWLVVCTEHSPSCLEASFELDDYYSPTGAGRSGFSLPWLAADFAFWFIPIYLGLIILSLLYRVSARIMHRLHI